MWCGWVQSFGRFCHVVCVLTGWQEEVRAAKYEQAVTKLNDLAVLSESISARLSSVLGR